jgi:hypothetical protein
MSEALVALAAAGGTAVVQAAGTDAWTQLRTGLARLVGRGAGDEEQRTLSRLDRTAAELADADDEAVGGLRARHAGSWQARFEAFLDSLPEGERDAAAAELRLLVTELPQSGRGEGKRFEISGGNFHAPVQVAENIHGTTFHMAPSPPAGNQDRDTPDRYIGDPGADDRDIDDRYTDGAADAGGPPYPRSAR